MFLVNIKFITFGNLNIISKQIVPKFQNRLKVYYFHWSTLQQVFKRLMIIRFYCCCYNIYICHLLLVLKLCNTFFLNRKVINSYKFASLLIAFFMLFPFIYIRINFHLNAFASSVNIFVHYFYFSVKQNYKLQLYFYGQLIPFFIFILFSFNSINALSID